MTHALVDSLDKVIDNIARYKIEVGREPRLAGQMKMVRAWYADRVNDGKWFFGPSKFVGYASSTAKACLSKIDKGDTYRSEAVLKEWFDIVPPASPLEAELADALRRFLNAYGHSGPRKNAWICVRKDILAGSADSVSRAGTHRIHMDSAICASLNFERLIAPPKAECAPAEGRCVSWGARWEVGHDPCVRRHQLESRCTAHRI